MRWWLHGGENLLFWDGDGWLLISDDDRKVATVWWPAESFSAVAMADCSLSVGSLWALALTKYSPATYFVEKIIVRVNPSKVPAGRWARLPARETIKFTKRSKFGQIICSTNSQNPQAIISTPWASWEQTQKWSYSSEDFSFMIMITFI